MIHNATNIVSLGNTSSDDVGWQMKCDSAVTSTSRYCWLPLEACDARLARLKYKITGEENNIHSPSISLPTI